MDLGSALAEIVATAVARAVEPLQHELAALRHTLDERLPPPWLTRQQAANALGCSLAQVDRQIATGLLQSRRIGARGLRVLLPAQPEALALLAREPDGACTIGLGDPTRCPTCGYVHGNLSDREPCARCCDEEWTVSLVVAGPRGRQRLCARCLLGGTPSAPDGTNWHAEGGPADG